MKITFDKAGFQRLLNRTKTTVSGVGEVAKTGATLMSQKTEDTLLCAKLAHRVKDLEEEIDLQLAEIGALIYATHTGNPSDSEVLLAKLQEIDALKAEIAEMQAQIKQEEEKHTCRTCGSAVRDGAVFCGECGEKL